VSGQSGTTGKDRYERVHPLSRAEWRAWLVANHATAPGIWFVAYKQGTGKPRVTYDELVEEALCFGWVDSLGRRLDEERTMLLVTPRKAKSGWSRPNKERISRLEAQGLIAPAGAAKIAAAKADGSWDLLDTVEALEVPPDLAAALAADAGAAAGFAAFAPSVQKPLLLWLVTARRPETRRRRIEEIVRGAAAGRNPLAWPRPAP
jgi:uncharacterized protein YdeI (YjbR/CyaY-like superfamily)